MIKHNELAQVEVSSEQSTMTTGAITSRLIDSEILVKSVSAIQSRKPSRTMELDKSQPPTPDGTGNPANLHQLAPGLYRSSYPSYSHFESLSKLDLKTIVTLVPQDIQPDYQEFMTAQGITHHHIPILANKDPATFTNVDTVHKVLNILLDPSNFPLLIHCNKGRHRTGCMVACFRKVTGWSMEACLSEYVRYSTPKERELDMKFIDRFDPTSLKSIAYERGFVGGVYKQPQGLSEESIRSMYTNNTLETYTSNEDDVSNPNYQETARKAYYDIIDAERTY